MNAVSAHHPAFELVRTRPIAALNVILEEYRHKVTGAQHIHLSADSEENVFLVALRTVPMDSTGVAHILEHTALCGSEKYPVRDPFFMMVRRSLNTFMNAFTSSDWTAYPFASQNRKDFFNLLDVYLDAVFFSRLDELDFAQEGHRVEFAESDNPDSELVYKGVVFNEMKGAMSSVPSQIWHTLCKYLYPTTTYHFNSGGEPDDIPSLSYDELKAFYKVHYHPSNAIFMTYGNYDVNELQEKFETQALHKFSALGKTIAVGDEKRYLSPVSVEEYYPLDEEEITADKNHIVIAWLLGKTTNLEETLEAQLLSNLLLDNSASPLQQVLETTDLGHAPSPLCGLDDSSREMAFVCGLEGIELDKAQQVEDLIVDCLQKVSETGLPKAQVEASLHQLELQQREIGGDGYPYGLQLILTALNAATHRGDPVGLLDIDAALSHLRNKIQDPQFVPQLVKKWLLDNNHRVRLIMKPDTQLTSKMLAAEKAKLANLKAQLSEDDKQRIVEKTKALQARQMQVDDDSILPKVDLSDVPPELHYTAGSHETLGDKQLRCYHAGTNGLVYQQVTVSLPALTQDEIAVLPYYCSFLTELAVGEQSYLDVQQRQAEVVGSLRAFNSIRGKGDDVQDISAYLTLSGKALAPNHSAMTQLMFDTFYKVRFDEFDRIRELVAQKRARAEQSVTGHGHSLAMTLASAGMSPAAQLAHQLGGLAGIAFLKNLDDSLNNPEELKAFAERLADLHTKLIAQPQQFLLVGEQEHMDNYRKALGSVWQNAEAGGTASVFTQSPVAYQVKEAWLTNTKVNFCAKAYPSVPADHPDAAPLTVLASFLRNGFLHRSIREQGGAYGGGASQDNTIAAFRFYSYRDPRLLETLSDFDASLEWLQTAEHTQQSLVEAILGVVGSIDKPGSPAGEAKSTYQAELFGRTREKREAFRNRVVAVTLDDLKRVARAYLTPEKASIGLVTHSGCKDQVEAAGLKVIQL